MSRIVKEAKLIGTKNNVELWLMHIDCDTMQDLPAANAYGSGTLICIGSTAHIIEDNSTLEINSAGNWIQQLAGSSTYTRAEVDAIVLGLQNQIDNKISINDVFGERTTLQNVDLNDIKTPNKYVSGGSSTTASLTNCPATSAFIMFVDTVASPYRIVQRIYEYDTISATIKFYIRAYISSGWGAWYTVQLTQSSP